MREVWEETGLLVEPMQLRGVFGGPEYRAWYANGDEVGYMMAVYECRATGGSLRSDGDEIAEARYFSMDELSSITLSRWARIVVPELMVNAGPWLPPVTWQPSMIRSQVAIERATHSTSSPTAISPPSITSANAPPPQRSRIASCSPGSASSMRSHGRVSP